VRVTAEAARRFLVVRCREVFEAYNKGLSLVPASEFAWFRATWYVLPISFRDRLVGRIEPRIDRADARVQVLDVWGENGFAPRRAEGFVDAMRDALRAYLRFAAASRLEWAPHLGTERRLFLTRS
jgi:hypothetical protein